MEVLERPFRAGKTVHGDGMGSVYTGVGVTMSSKCIV